MPIKQAQITKHAWLRFRSRWTGEPPNDYSEEIRKLVADAQEEDLGHATAVRIITNGFKPARYFRTGEWRFVTNEEATVIMTIERAYFQKWKEIKKIKQPRRGKKV